MVCRLVFSASSRVLCTIDVAVTMESTVPLPRL